MDNKVESVALIAGAVLRFFGCNLRKTRNSVKYGSKEWLARCIFYKYGLEHGFDGPQLAHYIGYKADMSYKMRRALTKSFKTNEENRTTYRRFCQHMEELLQENIENSVV